MKSIKDAENNVVLEGILSETSLEKKVDASGKNYIAGRVTILVPQTIGDVEEEDYIPLDMFSYEFYKSGDKSLAYTNLEDVMDNFTSIQALIGSNSTSPEEARKNADRVRIESRNGSLALNKFPDKKTGKDVENTIIRGSFLKKVKGNMPQAAFFEEVLIKSIEPERINDEKTGRLLIEAFVPQWTNSMDKLTFVVENKKDIAYITANWKEKDTVKVEGLIRKTVVKQTSDDSQVELGFGTHIKETTEKVVFELVITGGSARGYDPDIAYDVEEVLEALNKKEQVYQEKKNSRPNSPKVDRGC